MSEHYDLRQMAEQAIIPLVSIKSEGPLIPNQGPVRPNTLLPDGTTPAPAYPLNSGSPNVYRPNNLNRDRIAYTTRASVTIATSRVGKGFLTEVAVWDRVNRRHFGGWTVVAASESRSKARTAHSRVVDTYRASDRAID